MEIQELELEIDFGFKLILETPDAGVQKSFLYHSAVSVTQLYLCIYFFYSALITASA